MPRPSTNDSGLPAINHAPPGLVCLLSDGFVSERVDVSLHFFLLTLDGLSQLDLGATAIQVVEGAMDPEVSVPLQEISEEAEPDRVSHELARKGD